jgi:hypothetical protein
MTKLRFTVVALMLTSAAGLAQGQHRTATPSSGQSRPWIRITLASAKEGFKLTSGRGIEYRGRVLEGAKLPEWAEEIDISPIGGDRFAFAIPVTIGDAGFGYLLDLKTGTNREMRFRSPLYRVASWSPTVSRLLLASSYEGDADLHIVTLAPFSVDDVVLPKVRSGELLRFDITNVSWESDRSVAVAAHTVCNRYDDTVRGKCDPSVIMRRVTLVVNAVTRQAVIR